MNRWLEFLYDAEGESLEDLRKDLKAYGVNYQRVVQRVHALMDNLAVSAPTNARRDWLTEARLKQMRFEALLREKKLTLSRKFETSKTLLGELWSGEGDNQAAPAGVFFRNQVDGAPLSSADQQSYAEDLSLLASIEANETKKERPPKKKNVRSPKSRAKRKK